MKAQSDLTGDRESAGEIAAPAEHRRATNRIPTETMKTSLAETVTGIIEAQLPSMKSIVETIRGAADRIEIPDLSLELPIQTDFISSEVSSPPMPATAWPNPRKFGETLPAQISSHQINPILCFVVLRKGVIECSRFFVHFYCVSGICAAGHPRGL